MSGQYFLLRNILNGDSRATNVLLNVSSMLASIGSYKTVVKIITV